MARTRQWQATATFPGGGTMVFGVSAASLPAALLKAYQAVTETGVATSLTITRLYGRHHPLRGTSRDRRTP